MVQETQTQADAAGDMPSGPEKTSPHEHLEEYGGGHIKARHGRVDAWLLAVYAVLFIWALYYGYVYWGGLGPGLDY